MAGKSQMMAEIVITSLLPRAIRERWSVRRMAKETGYNLHTCSRFYANFLEQTRVNALSDLTGFPPGIWSQLHETARIDGEYVAKWRNKARGICESREYTAAVVRLAAIAHAAAGRSPMTAIPEPKNPKTPDEST